MLELRQQSQVLGVGSAPTAFGLTDRTFFLVESSDRFLEVALKTFFFAFGFAIATALCGCNKPDPNAPPVAVHIESLYRVHRDSPDLAGTAWGGRRVKVVLRSGDYQVSNFDVHWHNGHPQSAAVVIFHCGRPNLDNSREIEITGLCRGRVKDDIERGMGVFWHIAVEGCSVTPVASWK